MLLTRGLATAVVLVLAVSACSKDKDGSSPGPSSAPSGTASVGTPSATAPSPGASATAPSTGASATTAPSGTATTPAHSTGKVEPAGTVVPLNGTSDAQLVWNLEDPEAADDPAVTVARRAEALTLLGRSSTQAPWTNRAKLDSALAALTAPGVLDAGTVAKWSNSKKSPALAGPLHYLVSPAIGSAGKVQVLMCVDIHSAYPEAPRNPDGRSPVVRVWTVSNKTGPWKAIAFEQHPTNDKKPGTTKAFNTHCENPS
ncbi:hypothetical protein F1D05_07320 [Kribbella qitaiheensis]|uniref:Lipoprotein n=1 Tax=Kribbella qitaiheensis TaxID=1544730 RepID=A0A7G6WUT6_9ACTN|nr:hypothetical protein [Kribbella qitaiheensis]QNE17751.1 hypothetical protein F1D05_07320 [Kribbella qitaiheensis]